MNAGSVRWLGVAGAEELRSIACRRILDAAAHAITARGQFLIVLAGGETPRGVYRMLRDAKAQWPRWHIYFGDERCVAAADEQRNSSMAAREWLDHVAIPRYQIHAIPAELGALAGAKDYANTLRTVGDFDLVLLGLGGDGHTASLFPGHDWGLESNAPDVLAVFDAPKAPPERVSLSVARLNRAREVLFLIAGESKGEAVMRWRAGKPLPAAAIQPAAGVDVIVESELLEMGSTVSGT